MELCNTGCAARSSRRSLKYEDQVQRKAPGQAEDGEDEAGGASRGSRAGSFGCSQASVRNCKSAF